MNLKLIIIITFCYAYGGFELFMSLWQRRKNKISKRGDKGSIWFLIICISLAYWTTFMIAMTKTGRVSHWNLMFGLGATLVIIGLIIRVTSILTLSKQFTYRVTNIEDHKLIQTGLYKWIRHPGYLGQFFIFIGTAAALSNWISVISMLVFILIGYGYRIRVEEKFLVKLFGEEYINYKKQTWRLIPGIY